VSFYRDQATHHAAALTYYALMAPLSAAVKAALKSRGTAAAALALAVAAALYGGTGYLEATRRALNVVFECARGRSFVRRKLTDVASLLVLLALVLITIVLIFAGASLTRRVLGAGPADVWRVARWPLAFLSALLVFSFIYYVTPDIRHRGFHWIVPGALVGVALWLAMSAAFSEYLDHFDSFNVTYGSFAAAIILLVWLWLTNLTMLFGAEVNGEIERVNQIADGVPEAEARKHPPVS
jgi:membrane protein